MDYNKIYKQIIDNRKINKPTGYTETHHIIPKSLGGTDDASNLVVLTAREHFICHWILLKIQKHKSKEYYSMLRAFLMMVQCRSQNQQRYITSRNYEKIRLEYNELQKVSCKGENNSQYGTKWISNTKLKISKKIPKSELTPTEWIDGRIINWHTHYTNRLCKGCNKIGCLSRSSSYCSISCVKNVTKQKMINENMIVKPINKPRKDMVYFENNFLDKYREFKCIKKTLDYFNKNTKVYYRKGKSLILGSNDKELICIFKENCTKIRSLAHKKKI